MNYLLSAKSSDDVARKVKCDLEAAGLTVHPECPPGANRIQSVNTAIINSGVIILLITKIPSHYFLQTVKHLCKDYSKTIMPIFFNISPDEVNDLLEKPAFMRLSLSQHVMYDDSGSMEKIISAIKIPHIGEYLFHKKTHRLNKTKSL